MSTQAGDPDSKVTRTGEANFHPRVNTRAPEAISEEWTAVVELIRAGDDNGVKRLYRIFDRGVRCYLARRVGCQELDQHVQDVLLTVVRGIEGGELHDPGRLAGFVRATARRRADDSNRDGHGGRWDRVRSGGAVPPAGSNGKGNSDWTTKADQRAEVMKRVLLSLSSSDRNILERFYVDGQKRAQICAETRLDDARFVLLKSRAKQLFIKFGQGENTKKPPTLESGQSVTRSATA